MTLKLTDRDGALALDRADLVELKVKRGRESKWCTGAYVGGAVGFVVGGIIGVTLPVEEGDFLFSEDETRLMRGLGYAGAGALAGGAAGALIGAFSHGVRWQREDLETLRLAVSPRYDGGVVFSLEYSF